MNQLDQQKTALTVGLFLGGWHAIWSILVAIGVAQAFYDFILWAHMIHLALVVGPFEITASLTLIAVTFVMGYIFGYVFAYIWNRLHKA